MASGSDQRREPRVAFSGFVRLRGLGEEESVEAEIRNLSALGMFVASKRVPEPGAAVFCRVVIGNDRRIIKGKVAWASPGSPAEPMGAGIEFIDLSQKDCEVLRTVVQTNVTHAPSPDAVDVVDSDSLGRVEVTFEGLAAPVNARARLTPEGIVLTTKLPFLRVGSNVKIRNLGATQSGSPVARQGKLQAVSLGSTGQDGVPRLLVELTVPTDELLPAPLDEWPAAAAIPSSPPPETLATQDTDPQPFTLPMPASALAAAADVPEQPSEAAAWVGAPRDFSDSDVTPVSNASELMSQLHVDIDSAVAPVAAGLLKDARPTPQASVPVAESIELNLTPLPAVLAPLLTPAPVSEPTMRVELFLDETAPSHAGMSMTAKLAIAAAVVAAVAGLFALSGDDLPAPVPSPKERVAAPVVASGIRIEPLPSAAPVIADAKAMAPTHAAAPARAVQKPQAAWRPIADPTWPFTVVAEGDTTTVFIPLQGDQADSRVYAINKPSGVVAVLPHGRIRGTVGKYPVKQAGVTQVWVEERETGLHARVVFGRSVQSHEATLEPTGLRVVAKLRAE